jgi:glycolate oxidase iron-sulfur subunit
VNLGLDPDELATCVACGLCLSHCPTFRVTGDESLSPRGRIALMRAVEHDGAPLTEEIRHSFMTCVQCSGCETACPSGVTFGHLIEQTRHALADESPLERRATEVALAPLTRPRVLRASTRLLALAERLRLVPRRLGLPRLSLRPPPPLPPTGDDVYLFTGCVMDAWQRDVHRDALFVLGAVGVGAEPTGDRAPCCGALHLHAGLSARTEAIAAEMMRTFGDHRPILVDSAGCGAAMKSYGRLLGTEEARRFSARVFDIGEWLAPRVGALADVAPLALRIAVQDPCHLRHVQRAHEATRDLLRPFVTDLVELDDEGLCCGAGGAYSLREPALARSIRDRKMAAIDRAAPQLVASANPGCAMFLGAAGVQTEHPVSIVARALRAGAAR